MFCFNLVLFSWKGLKWASPKSAQPTKVTIFDSFCLSLDRIILGGHTDASIDLTDPISDRFYKEVWMTTSGRNATIYEKVCADMKICLAEDLAHLLYVFKLAICRCFVLNVYNKFHVFCTSDTQTNSKQCSILI